MAMREMSILRKQRIRNSESLIIASEGVPKLREEILAFLVRRVNLAITQGGSYDQSGWNRGKTSRPCNFLLRGREVVFFYMT
ncbi:hypothetical protein SDC9_08951 [bioreactor metagenome]|uniref:Uncharacterized protein n=1 Tax=bioreactor metagenome TaxID=1076179 RepID=A0A644T8P7_9ZZZZ